MSGSRNELLRPQVNLIRKGRGLSLIVKNAHGRKGTAND
jgi:hypothetical protein